MCGRGVCAIDIDGVLVKPGDRYLCASTHDYLYGVEARNAGLEAVSRCRDRGFRVYIVSGRSLRCLESTLGVLESVGVVFDRIYLRDASRFRSVVEFKVSVVSDLASRFDCVEVHDDDPDVLRAIKRVLHGYRVRLFIHVDDRYSEF